MVADSQSQPVDHTSSVPPWLINLAALGWRVIAIAGLAVVLLWIGGLLWVVTASVAVGIVVSAVFAPAILRLREGGRSRNSAALIVWAIALTSISALVLVLAIAFVPYLADLIRAVEAGASSIQATLQQMGVPPAVATAIEAALKAILESGGALSSLATSVASAATIVLLAIFLVFFLLRDGDKGWLWLFQNLSAEKREAATIAGHDALTRVGGYLRGMTILAVIVAVTDYVFMILLGVPLALPLAVFAFLGGYIPYIGGLIASLAILAVTWSEHGLGTTVLMVVLLAARNVVVSYGLRPTLYSRAMSIHPAVVLLALPAGYAVAGVVGLFAAVPVTAVVLTGASTAISIIAPDPPPPTPALVPAWLDRLAQLSWRMLVLVGQGVLAIGFVVALPLVVIPIVCGLILAATLAPLAGALVKRGRTTGRAALITVAGTIVGIILALAAATLSLIGSSPGMVDSISAGASSANESTGGQLGMLQQAVAEISSSGLRTLADLLDNFAGAGLAAVLSALLAFYFLKDGRQAWDKFIGNVRPSAVPQVEAAGIRAFEALSGYMLGTAAISLAGAASQWLIMVLLGLPYAAPIFVLSFFLCFIPYIGGYISTGAAFLIALQTGDPVTIIVMFVFTMAFNIVQGNILAPIVYGKTVSIHPAIVLLAIPAGGAVAGILGMFLAIPVVGVVVATWRTVLAVLALRKDEFSNPDQPILMETKVETEFDPALTPEPEAAGA